MERLIKIQQSLKVAKDKDGFGYKYRDAEQILTALKPALEETKCAVICNAEYFTIDGKFFKKVTAALYGEDGKEIARASDVVITPDKLGSMCAQQISGSDTTYCKRYALQNLFAIDNGEDDLDNMKNPLNPKNQEKQAAKPVVKSETIPPAAAPAPAPTQKPAQPKSGLDAVTTAVQMQEMQMKLDEKYKSGAIKDDVYLAKQKQLNEHGKKIGCTYTAGEGWVSNNDLFAE